jgi:hypothetical protein
MSTKHYVFASALVALVALSVSDSAAEPAVHLEQTGFSIQRGPDGKVRYTLSHEVARRPTSRGPLAARDADVTKRVVMAFPEGMPCAAFRSMVTDGFVRNGLTSTADRSRAQTLAARCTGTSIAPRRRAVFYYDAITKVTRVWIEDMGTAELAGVDSMKAVWSLWFGAGEDAKTKDQLMSRVAK